jgi:hypothetical protein
MEIKYSYSSKQLELAVKFIAKHNKAFLKQKKYIREQIIQIMNKLVPDFGTYYISTMGFTLLADRELENIDNNYYACNVQILIDPSLGVDLDDDDFIEDTLISPITGLDE